MNQQQLKAIERFRKAYYNLDKVGLYLFLHESGFYVCKEKDIDKNVKDLDTGYSRGYGDDWHQIEDVFKRDKAVFLGIDVDVHNS